MDECCIACQQQRDITAGARAFSLHNQRVAPEVRFHEGTRRDQPKDEEHSGISPQDRDDNEVCFGNYYAVFRGRKPGVYDDWDEARKQVDRFPQNEHLRCPTLKGAIAYLRCKGIPSHHIRFFRKTFKHGLGFKPNPTSSFKQEFDRFASSQRWSDQEKRKARVDAIRDEIIQHVLPDGIRISAEQDDDEGYVDLEDDQTLEVFQAICRKVGKPAPPSINSCLVQLKAAPYVNILDFVDCYRTGIKIQTFTDWDKFEEYTMAGRKMDMQMAKDNEFLAPLLQDFRRGPGAVDPCTVRDTLLARRLAQRVQRAEQRRQDDVRQNLATTSRPHLPRALSPSVFDRSLSLPKPPTPAFERATPHIKNEYDKSNHCQMKGEPSTARSCSSSNLAALPSSPPIDYSDADCSGSDYGFEEFDETMLSDCSDSGYGLDQFDEAMLQDMKSQSMAPGPSVSRYPTTLASPFVTPFATPLATPLATPFATSAPISKKSKLNSRNWRLSSPRVVVSAKRRCSGAHYDFIPYTELPKTQTNIRSFFAPSQVRA
jgi:hypothetical protein